MVDLHPSDPRTVGRYRLVGRIGEGGMGVVFLAHDPDGREVALKLIRPDLAGDPGFRSRFAREVEAGRRVGGISCVRTLDGDLASSQPFLVTEYVPGGNLADYVSVHGPLAWEWLVELGIGLAQALVAMESVGVVHRDLKPTNVLLAGTGPKVADFGISQALDGSGLTQTGMVMGSPAWMAPEQATGAVATSATDVFAWGATMAYAGTGRPPFGEGRPDGILYRVVHEEPDLAGLDPRLVPAVQRALRKDPAERPTPDRLLIELIRTSASGVTVDARAGGSTTPVVGHSPGSATALGTLVPVAPTARSRRRRGRRAVLWALAAVVLLVGGVAAGAALEHEHSSHDSTATTAPGAAAGTGRTPGGTGGAGASTSTTAPSSVGTASVDLPLTVCPTTFGVQPTSVPDLPSRVSESVPTGLQSQLAVYTDQTGSLELLAPRGWSCSAQQGADGSGDVSVFPNGQPDPESSSTADEAIVGSQTGACVGCAVSQASPLFPDAAAACADQFDDSSDSCPSTPSGESDFAVASGVVGFLDPAGVQGSGVPSGGTYPANGVMTYPSQSSGDSPSYLDTCTLPQRMHTVCTAALDDFVSAYGSQ